jgi:hypothetical protein
MLLLRTLTDVSLLKFFVVWNRKKTCFEIFDLEH